MVTVTNEWHWAQLVKYANVPHSVFMSAPLLPCHTRNLYNECPQDVSRFSGRVPSRTLFLSRTTWSWMRCKLVHYSTLLAKRSRRAEVSTWRIASFARECCFEADTVTAQHSADSKAPTHPAVGGPLVCANSRWDRTVEYSCKETAHAHTATKQDARENHFISSTSSTTRKHALAAGRSSWKLKSRRKTTSLCSASRAALTQKLTHQKNSDPHQYPVINASVQSEIALRIRKVVHPGKWSQILAPKQDMMMWQEIGNLCGSIGCTEHHMAYIHASLDSSQIQRQLSFSIVTARNSER